MSNMTSESEDRIMSMDCVSSPTIDDVSTERNMVGNGTLKKGPWTSAEDAILVDYVNKHGEGNWNAVQKHSGLSRCGKSCRLRWANHLRPDLKKGAFTPEEERRIIELHAKMGNKWARMAVELPGRTDNEIKNFWNTRTKRRQRAGLPIYPPDICLQTLNDNTQSHNMVTFANGDTSSADIMPGNHFPIPSMEFKNLELNHELYLPSILDLSGGSFLDIPGGSLLPPVLDNSFPFPMAHSPKRIRRSDTYLVFDDDDGGGGGGGLDDIFPMVNLYEDDIFSSYNQNVNTDIPFSGSHAFINGNTSSSEPISWATKMELPSLQYSTQVGSCGAASSPLPSLESVDTLMHSTMIGQSQTKSKSMSGCPSPRNCGLLEAVLYESQTMNMSKSNNNSNASCDDPMSPSASVLSEYNPFNTRSLLDEHYSLEAISVKHEAEGSGAKQSEEEDDKSNHMKYFRPDYLLGSNWFDSEQTLKQPALWDGISDVK